jgi:hypothetical protein
MNGNGIQITCHLAVPSAVCSSRRSSPATATSGSPPLLSCIHSLYTDTNLQRAQAKTDWGKPARSQHGIRKNDDGAARKNEKGETEEGIDGKATHRSADSWTSSAARKKGSFSHRSKDVAISLTGWIGIEGKPREEQAGFLSGQQRFGWGTASLCFRGGGSLGCLLFRCGGRGHCRVRQRGRHRC